MTNIIDIDLMLGRMQNQLDVMDDAISEHISKGVTMDTLRPLARARANLSIQRKEILEERTISFDSESTLSGMGHITVETIR